MLNTIATRFLNWIFPRRCVLCRQFIDSLPHAQAPALDLCDGCATDLPVIEHACVQCGIPLASTATICGQCLKKAPYFDYTFSLYHYQSPVSWLIKQSKFSNKPAICYLLGQLFAHHLATKISINPDETPDIVIPVPLHPKRRFQRGYNQSEIIVDGFLAGLKQGKLPVTSIKSAPKKTHLLLRTINNPQQTGLDATTRKKNVRNIFKLKRTLPTDIRHVAIVDDVMSTGSTVNEIARLLKKSGITRVDVWVIARADHK